MKVYIIGSGGREYKLAIEMLKSPHVASVAMGPGNGGTGSLHGCRNVKIANTDIDSHIAFARAWGADLTIVGPETLLVEDIVGRWPKGQRIWGSSAELAQLEGDKVYAKKLMVANRVPTASYEIFGSIEHALSWLQSQPEKGYAVKPKGLTGGKGVQVCHDKAETAIGIAKMAEYGKWFIIEDLLSGWEASLIVIVDTEGRIEPLVSAQDFKSQYEGGLGPNTGGMGCYSPIPRLTPKMVQAAIETTIRPMVEATGYSGTLYAALMLNESGESVLEYNARFGDPETQGSLALLESDLFQWLYEGSTGSFPQGSLKWSNEVAVHVVLCAQGYPEKPELGSEILGLDWIAKEMPEIEIIHAGTVLDGNKLKVASGRVLGLTGKGNDHGEAREKVYNAASLVSLKGGGKLAYRTDIATGV